MIGQGHDLTWYATAGKKAARNGSKFKGQFGRRLFATLLTWLIRWKARNADCPADVRAALDALESGVRAIALQGINPAFGPIAGIQAFGAGVKAWVNRRPGKTE